MVVVRMGIRKSTLAGIGVPLVLLFLFFFGPVYWYIFQTHRWESRIRRQQDPAELRTWATGIVAAYGTEMDIRKVTNQPPAGVPRSVYGPKVFVVNGRGDEPYVRLGWGSGFLPAWGLDIGTTNLVRGGRGFWQPGMYFYGHR